MKNSEADFVKGPAPIFLDFFEISNFWKLCHTTGARAGKGQVYHAILSLNRSSALAVFRCVTLLLQSRCSQVIAFCYVLETFKFRFSLQRCLPIDFRCPLSITRPVGVD